MELLWQSQRRKTLISWPQAIDDRLDILVRAATAAGENVSRAQVLAALVAVADQRPSRIAELVHDYRRTDADDFTRANLSGGLPTPRRPGRRRR